MRRELTQPGWLILIIFILWGIAGKLDEPLEGFDPEPTASAGEETVFPPIHLLCYLDEGHDGRNSPKSGAAVVTSIQPSQQPRTHHVAGQGRLLQCAVSDD